MHYIGQVIKFYVKKKIYITKQYICINIYICTIYFSRFTGLWEVDNRICGHLFNYWRDLCSYTKSYNCFYLRGKKILEKPQSLKFVDFESVRERVKSDKILVTIYGRQIKFYLLKHTDETWTPYSRLAYGRP